MVGKEVKQKLGSGDSLPQLTASLDTSSSGYQPRARPNNEYSNIILERPQVFGYQQSIVYLSAP